MARSFLCGVTVLAFVMASVQPIFAQNKPNLISLYFKEPKKQPLVYSCSVSEEVLSKDAKGKPERTTFRNDQTITNLYKLVGPETLAIKAQFTDFRTVVNGKEVAYTPPQKEAQRLIDVKGYRKKANKTAADFDKFDVILPNYPVAVGESWTYTAPPTSDLPLYLVTKYTLAKVEKRDGRDVAVIDASTRASETEPIRRLKISVHAEGRILFSCGDGVLLSSTFKVNVITEPLAGTIGRITKRIKTSMRLVKG